MKRWIKRITFFLACLLVVALLAGIVFEQVMKARTAKEFPPPGKMVDIGGRRMQIDCRGTGTPTVVFEAGLDGRGSLSFSAVHDAVATTTRACAYSRAGLLWSDPSSSEFNPQNVAKDLHTLLARAGERGPFVMVGHSLGGPYLMIFTRLFPQDVAGLVFVDCSHPDQMERIEKATGKPMPDMTGMVKVADALSWSGITRLVASESESATGPEGQAKKVESAYLTKSIHAELAEAQNLAATLNEGGKLRQLEGRPLVVLTAMKPYPESALKMLKMSADQGRKLQASWKDMQDEEASWSTNSRHELVPDASHYIQFDRPDLVIAAVKEVVGQIRSASSGN